MIAVVGMYGAAATIPAGFGLLALVIFLVFGLPLFLYSWRILYPFGRRIAEWTTNRLNFIPFVLFMLLVLGVSAGLLVLWLVLYGQTDSLAFLILILLLIPILLTALVILNVPLVLAITLWIVRLCHWAFARFRGRFLAIAFGMMMWRAKRRHPSDNPGDLDVEDLDDVDVDDLDDV